MEIYVPRPILNHYCKVNSVQQLSENKAKEIIIHNNIKYVITGYGASGAKGYLWCSAKKVVFLDEYKGSLKPLPSDLCHIEVTEGKRERGYNGQLFTYDANQYVTINGKSITFLPTDQGTQLELF